MGLTLSNALTLFDNSASTTSVGAYPVLAATWRSFLKGMPIAFIF